MFYIIMAIFIIALLGYMLLHINSELTKSNAKVSELISENECLLSSNKELIRQVNSRLNPDEELIHEYKRMANELLAEKKSLSEFLEKNKNTEMNLRAVIEKLEKLEKQEYSQTNKIKKLKELYKSMNYSIDNYMKLSEISKLIQEEEFSTIPDVMLKLHHMDVKSLNKLFKDNQKEIDKVLSTYEYRYNTKTNKMIYHLMVVALQAELQNVLYNLKYENLEKATSDIKTITKKYLHIAEEGNQNIANTLIRFIGQIEYLFINAVKIEYNYYVKKEQAKQEQLAIRQQMREEAEERRLLKLEQDRIEKEEAKFKVELERTRELLLTAHESELDALNKKILELQGQLSDIIVKKDEIVNLQNGKAGNVYVISNLGSFGNDVFKIGMTRRIDPQERINELGSASVPFRFDVHSFIFSENAVELEKKIHDILDDKRVNKVNLRKEFFKCSIDELEKIVNELDPTAEFNKTMIAEEFHQSNSVNENYTSTYEKLSDEEELSD